VFTLGKYQCPAGSQYCGDWDYTIQNFLMTKTDTFELARLITPYANASYPRTPWTWQQRYYFDVTDYYPVLKDSAKMRLLYSGYSGGFTADIKFAFIEGTPPRNVLGVKKLWNGSFAFGNTADPINNHLAAVTTKAPTGSQFAEMKFTATGHGSDANGCGEFCSKYYLVYAGTKLVQQTTLWRNDCGSNELYPQSGTWAYNRANWCPGNLIAPNIHKIPGVIADSNISVSVKMQPYSVTTPSASFTIFSSLFFYGAYNNNVDASIERIISPTNYEGYYRENPICGKPVINVRNSGATNINSISFEYGLKGQPLQTYSLTGINLIPMKDTLISLPDLTSISKIPASKLNTFFATILQVNGATDAYQQNDTMTSNFATAPDWPSSFNITLKTNNVSTSKWSLQDVNGNVIMQRTPTAANTKYVDTVKALTDGCYKLVVTAASCNGLYWWANTAAGSGYFTVNQTNGTLIHLTNGLVDYTTSTTNSQDFGCGFTQYFRVGAILPLDLLSFNGKWQEKYNYLNWETSHETNTNHFDLEFSTNGKDYTKVYETKASGNKTSTAFYNTTHTPELKADLYYYRLKMVDNDGQFRYSEVVTIKPNAPVKTVAIEPNPCYDFIKLNVTVLAEQLSFINLYDIQGRLQKTKNLKLSKGDNQIILEGLNNLTSGIYIIELTIDGQKIVQKVMKK
ncbi:MAG: peptide-N-glycosidase F-related protein, partial [Bacteroidota bacterium]